MSFKVNLLFSILIALATISSVYAGDKENGKDFLSTITMKGKCNNNIAQCLRKNDSLAVIYKDWVKILKEKGVKEGKIRELLQKRIGARTIDHDLVSIIGQEPIGDITAPVKIVVFSDFECPYCSKMEETIDAVTKIKGIGVVFYEIPFPIKGHPHALDAAMSAEYARLKGKFRTVALLLHKNYDSLEEEKINKILDDCGLDHKKYRKLIKEDDSIMNTVATNKMKGLVAGVRATPTLFINWREYSGGHSKEDLLNFIKEAKERIKK